MRPLTRALAVVGLLLAGAPAHSLGTSPAESARRILADARFQRELPGRPAETEEQPAAARGAAREPEPVRVSLPDLGGAGAIVRLLGEGFLFLAALLLVLWAIQRLLLRAAPALPPEPGAADPAGTGKEEGGPSLEEAQRLAREGRYVEALHHLLLAAIHRFAERGKRAVQPHLTSRELARTLPLGPDSRQAFRELVAAVEGPLFGGAAVGAEDFARGVERYRTLAEGRLHGS